MALYVKDAGVWKLSTSPSVRDAGVWKTPTQGYARDGGVWKPFHTSKYARFNQVGVTTTGTTTRTFSSIEFGPAAADRRVVVLVNTHYASTYITVSSASIGGISATVHYLAFNRDSDWGSRLVLISATVPTGTSGNVVITLSQSPSSIRCSCFSLYGYSSAPTAFGRQSNVSFSYRYWQNIAVNISAGGFYAVVSAWENATFTTGNWYSGANPSTTALNWPGSVVVDENTLNLRASLLYWLETGTKSETINITQTERNQRGHASIWVYWQ